jgi:hypothetical protein
MYSLKNNNENVYINVYLIFQSSMYPRKSRHDIPNDTTQGCFLPFHPFQPTISHNIIENHMT